MGTPKTAMGSLISTPEITRTTATQTTERHLGSGKSVQQLLPGIPDEITLEEICTKLPWRAFKILSSVSLTWQKAIESRQVYNVRVRTSSTETLVVHSHFEDYLRRFALYSRRDQRCYELPPIPHLGERVPDICECVGLDGKLYVFGGEGPDHNTSAEVFVLDVAGGREWKQCASMREPKNSFGCGISGGKIYACGGYLGGPQSSTSLPVRESEVYDPKMNAWSPIMPMPSLRGSHSVVTVGDELFAYHGDVYEGDVWLEQPSFHVYHPTTNEWTVVEHGEISPHDPIFVAEGELHSMSDVCIRVYDFEKASWIERHSNSYRGLDQDSDDILARSTLAVNNELVATIITRHTTDKRVSLVQSSGFDKGKKETVWHDTGCRRASELFSGLFLISL